MGGNGPGVLFVCMGNICRSPSAEAVFLRHLEASALAGQISVDSAGTIGYHEGNPADVRMQHHAGLRGYRLRSRARKVVNEDFHRFDLIVAMDRDNLADLQARRPSSATCELRLFCDFVPSDDAPRDVPDPYYGGAEGFERVLDLLEEGVTGLLDYIASRRAGGGQPE
jgi:protein-tyrosine phosphatase